MITTTITKHVALAGTDGGQELEGTIGENLSGLRETIRASRTMWKMLLEASEKGS